MKEGNDVSPVSPTSSFTPIFFDEREFQAKMIELIRVLTSISPRSSAVERQREVVKSVIKNA